MLYTCVHVSPSPPPGKENLVADFLAWGRGILHEGGDSTWGRGITWGREYNTRVTSYLDCVVLVIGFWFLFFFLKAVKMFYQEKHPGEKSAHLFQTNKCDLLIISLLLGRHFGSLMAPLGPPTTWVSTALLWLQKNIFLALFGWLAMKPPQTGCENNCGQQTSQSLTLLETLVRVPGMATASSQLLTLSCPSQH